MIEKIFVCCLSAGFLFSFLFFFTGGRFRFLRGKHFRVSKIRIRKFSGTTRNDLMPWGTPIFLGMFLTLFGFSGLVLKILLHVPPVPSFLIAATAGITAAGAGVWLFNRYFAVTANEVKGNPLPGMIGHVSLTIPEGGVGSIACRSEGRRMIVPARDRKGHAVSKGSRVIVVDIQDRVALVEEL